MGKMPGGEPPGCGDGHGAAAMGGAGGERARVGGVDRECSRVGHVRSGRVDSKDVYRRLSPTRARGNVTGIVCVCSRRVQVEGLIRLRSSQRARFDTREMMALRMTSALGARATVAGTKVRAREASAARPTAARGRASSVSVRAAVDPTVAYAVAQQDLFFAALVAGECAYQQGNLPADFKGRPEFKDIALPCGLLVGSFLAIQTDNGIVTPGGLVLGAAACGLAGKMFLDRFDAIDDDGMDWPGPRVFPGTGILFALFAFLANVEALPRIMGSA